MQKDGKIHLVDEGGYHGYEEISACSISRGNARARGLSWQADADLCGR
jgi:hypothetical protein